MTKFRYFGEKKYSKEAHALKNVNYILLIYINILLYIIFI